MRKSGGRARRLLEGHARPVLGRRERQELMERLRADGQRIAAHFGLEYRAIEAEDPRVRRRYGSFHSDGVIKVRLAHVRTGRPLKYSSLIDTLCHELAHVRHFRHGPRFRTFYERILEWARAEGIYRPTRGRPQPPVAVAARETPSRARPPEHRKRLAPQPEQLTLFAAAEGFELIDLDQPLPGYREFLSSWAYHSVALTFLVDPGPTATIPHVVESLAQLGIDRLDFILLTHIHLDHGGGVGDLLRVFPQARVFCHEMGRRHLVDPARLWEGSRQVLGEVADVYGPPQPVPEASLAGEAELHARGILPLSTPGHAPHHISFIVGETLIAGEVIGLRCPLPSPRSGAFFLRPATPPRFFLEDALSSIDRLLELAPQLQRILFAHYGSDGRPGEYLRAGRAQLVHWVAILRELSDASRENLIERFHKRLLTSDPLYAPFVHLAEDVQARERHYLGQTIQGLLGYIDATRAGT